MIEFDCILLFTILSKKFASIGFIDANDNFEVKPLFSFLFVSSSLGIQDLEVFREAFFW